MSNNELICPECLKNHCKHCKCERCDIAQKEECPYAGHFVDKKVHEQTCKKHYPSKSSWEEEFDEKWEKSISEGGFVKEFTYSPNARIPAPIKDFISTRFVSKEELRGKIEGMKDKVFSVQHKITEDLTTIEGVTKNSEQSVKDYFEAKNKKEGYDIALDNVLKLLE